MLYRNGVAKYPEHVKLTIRSLILSNTDNLIAAATHNLRGIISAGINPDSEEIFSVVKSINNMPIIATAHQALTFLASSLPYYSRDKLINLISRSGLPDAELFSLLSRIHTIEFNISIYVIVLPSTQFLSARGLWGGYEADKVFKRLADKSTDRVLDLGLIIIPVPYDELNLLNDSQYIDQLDKIVEHELKHMVQSAFNVSDNYYKRSPLTWDVKGSKLHKFETLPGIDSVVDTYIAGAVSTYFAFGLARSARLKITEVSIRTLAEVIVYVALLTFRDDLSSKDKKRLFSLFKRSINRTHFDVGDIKKRSRELMEQTPSGTDIAAALNTPDVRELVLHLKVLLPQKIRQPRSAETHLAEDQEYMHKIDEFNGKVLKLLDISWRRTPALP